MTHYTYKPQMVCSMQIDFDIEGNVISNIQFIGGCNGNLKAISKILEGWTVEDIEARIKGNTCGRKPTSCADQLAIAVRKAYDEQKSA
ncbi:MAG: TIGR03905 family TSCPD domain-containing protein [Oscillospiraceae bacterium]|nr:TIGR03905 family TSCPD domain-containing protein [Oscillospiraceae bacterium]